MFRQLELEIVHIMVQSHRFLSEREKVGGHMGILYIFPGDTFSSLPYPLILFSFYYTYLFDCQYCRKIFNETEIILFYILYLVCLYNCTCCLYFSYVYK